MQSWQNALQFHINFSVEDKHVLDVRIWSSCPCAGLFTTIFGDNKFSGILAWPSRFCHQKDFLSAKEAARSSKIYWLTVCV